LLESFEAVLEMERKAEETISEAKEKAEEIRNNAQEKAKAVYDQTFSKIIAEAELKSIEIKNQAKRDAESEAQIYMKNAEKLKKEILVCAEQKFDEAVNTILDEILQ
jgi:F0F1-type ATP synthase membrane subunit b/b'